MYGVIEVDRYEIVFLSGVGLGYAWGVTRW